MAKRLDPNEKAYRALIRRVRRIDPDAADYMQTDARKLESFTPGSELICIFLWTHTPQGFHYWWRIEDQLLGKTCGQKIYRFFACPRTGKSFTGRRSY